MRPRPFEPEPEGDHSEYVVDRASEPVNEYETPAVRI